MIIINTRIKKVRKQLDLTQVAFAQKIGLKQNSIALIESGKRNISDQAILSICREFNVSESWLRTGQGEMFNPTPRTELDALADKYNLSHDAYVLIEKFVTLKEDQRNVIINFIREAAASLSESVPSSKASTIDIDAEVEAYRQALEMQKKAEAELSVMNGVNALGENKKKA